MEQKDADLVVQNLEVIHDPRCGKLYVTPWRTVAAIDFKTSEAHYHSTFAEEYLCLRGTLELALYDYRTGQRTLISLEPGQFIRIPPNVGHKVQGGGDGNAIEVRSVPEWKEGDEFPCPELES